LLQQMLVLSKKAVLMSLRLRLAQGVLQSLGLPSEPPPAAAAAACVEEWLGALLQLTDRLLYQQPPTPAAAAATAPATTGGSSSQGGAQAGSEFLRSVCLGPLLSLLMNAAVASAAAEGRDPGSNPNSDSHSHSDSSLKSAAAATCSSEAVAVTPVAAKFVEFVTALEATLRTIAQVLSQSGRISMHFDANTLATLPMLLHGDHIHSLLLLLHMHMGLLGPAALAQEQQQLYSLLRTPQKMRSCVRVECQWFFDEGMADSCCLAAVRAAMGLLNMAVAGGSAETDLTSQSHAAAAATAAAQQSAVSYLPSLAIIGRCMQQWAGQLQQQAPDLLLLGSEGPQNQQDSDTLPHAKLSDDSAACVCLPWLREGSAIEPGHRLDGLAATMSEWVGGIQHSPAHVQLMAAGCSPQQLQQQLDVLLSAQQGTQHILTDASLAALVQQLQATGDLLSIIAVPHFCNNPACVNLSGPTEVRLVSGRSCICAGCRVARYCGRACQRAAWKQHKHVCEALAAAATTTATPASL
jgi:hypothetical protein